MVYNITVDVSNEQAISFMDFIKMLARDYKFLKIEEIESNQIFSEELEIELDKRLDYVMKNPEIGKSWDEIEQNLLK